MKKIYTGVIGMILFFISVGNVSADMEFEYSIGNGEISDSSSVLQKYTTKSNCNSKSKFSIMGLNLGRGVECNGIPLPVNGVCGSSNGTSIVGVPATNLCSNGVSSSITTIFSGLDPISYQWSCDGENGGTQSVCNATPKVTCNATTYTVNQGVFSGSVINFAETPLGQNKTGTGIVSNGTMSQISTCQNDGTWGVLSTPNIVCNSGYFGGGNGSISDSLCSLPQYPGCNTPDYIAPNGQIVAMCNVGASQSWNGFTQPTNCGGSPSNCNSGNSFIGNYYQWGRNDNLIDSTTYTLANSVPVMHNLFILNGGGNYDWLNIQNNTLWSGGNNQGPCASGYHVPTQSEWSSVISIISPTLQTSVVAQTLKLPYSGFRHYGMGGYNNAGLITQYWTSTVSSNLVYTLPISSGSSTINLTVSYPRAFGFPVRCFKN